MTTIAESRIAAPRVEKILAAIWEQALSVSNIGPDANFFDLGGTPGMAAQLSQKIGT